MIATAMIAVALLLPLTGIFFFRLYENQLVRSTEAELIAQCASIRAAILQYLSVRTTDGFPLGPHVPPVTLPRNEHWSPTLPQLDISTTPILGKRPDPRPAQTPMAEAYRELGEFVDPMLVDIQQTTLAGFRLLDFTGTVIAGRSEVGTSLAHVDEVSLALEGIYASTLRERAVDNSQPIYSISRGTRVRIFAAMPVIFENRVFAVIYASRTPSNVVKELYFERKRLIGMAVAIIAAASGMIFIFSRAVSGPVQALARRAARIGHGDRNAIGPLDRYGSREVEALSGELMSMSRRLYDRADYINAFATHVSHELKSPLTAIRGAVELVRDTEMTPGERAHFLSNIERDTTRLTALVDRLRELARADNAVPSGRADLESVLNAAQVRFEGMSLEFSGTAVLPMTPESAGMIFDNLLENSRNHGSATVRIWTEKEPEQVCIHIADNGSGISQGSSMHVFDMFYTTRRDAGGTGLGLSIVSSLIKTHGGTISLVPSPYGAHFLITLPGANDQLNQG